MAGPWYTMHAGGVADTGAWNDEKDPLEVTKDPPFKLHHKLIKKYLTFIIIFGMYNKKI